MSEQITVIEWIESEIEQLGFKLDGHLKKSGWKHTCDTPGGYWMWEREYEGRILLVSRSHAIVLQQQWDAESEGE